jgi:hypothetical protein
MDQVTQQNASLVEEAAAASESMQNEAQKLAETVAVFKVPGGHRIAPAPARQAARRASPYCSVRERRLERVLSAFYKLDDEKDPPTLVLFLSLNPASRSFFPIYNQQ